MKRNVGSGDALARIVISVLIAGAGIYFKNWLGLIAIIPAVTAFTGFCPLYKLLGINTCKKPQRS